MPTIAEGTPLPSPPGWLIARGDDRSVTLYVAPHLAPIFEDMSRALRQEEREMGTISYTSGDFFEMLREMYVAFYSGGEHYSEVGGEA